MGLTAPKKRGKLFTMGRELGTPHRLDLRNTIELTVSMCNEYDRGSTPQHRALP